MYLEALHLETGKPKIEWSAKMPVPMIQATISKNKKSKMDSLHCGARGCVVIKSSYMI